MKVSVGWLAIHFNLHDSTESSCTLAHIQNRAVKINLFALSAISLDGQLPASMPQSYRHPSTGDTLRVRHSLPVMLPSSFRHH